MARRRQRTPLFGKKGKNGTIGNKRKIAIWTGGIVGGVLLIVVIAYFWTLSWLQSDGFREQLQESLSNKIEADITLPAPLVIDGDQVSLSGLEFRDTEFVKKADIKGISTNIKRGELLNRCLHAPVVSIRELSVSMDSLKEAAKTYPQEESSGLFSAFKPNRYVIDQIECGDLQANLLFRRSDKTQKPNKYSLKGSSMTASPKDDSTQQWDINLRNGTFSTSHRYLAKSKLKHARLSYTPERIRMHECQLALTKGSMDATGSFGLKEKDWDISLRVGNADVERLLSTEWQEILTGDFSGELRMNGKRRVIQKADGYFALRKGRFKLLSFIALYMSSDSRQDKALRIPGQKAATDYLEETFKIVEISRADCDIQYPHTDKNKSIKNAWLFDNLEIHTKEDTLRLVGHVILEQDGKLHGNIRLGINDKVIEDFLAKTTLPFTPIIRAAIPRLFNAEGEAGFHWVNINLSGTGDSPQQDLTARIKELTRDFSPGSILEKTKDLLPDALQPQKDGSKDSGSLIDTATDTATDVLDAGIKALPIF